MYVLKKLEKNEVIEYFGLLHIKMMNKNRTNDK